MVDRKNVCGFQKGCIYTGSPAFGTWGPASPLINPSIKHPQVSELCQFFSSKHICAFNRLEQPFGVWFTYFRGTLDDIRGWEVGKLISEAYFSI